MFPTVTTQSHRPAYLRLASTPARWRGVTNYDGVYLDPMRMTQRLRAIARPTNGERQPARAERAGREARHVAPEEAGS